MRQIHGGLSARHKSDDIHTAFRPFHYDLHMSADLIRDQWDRAADGYAAGQDAGLDFYRHEFFGPAQIGLCGEVCGLSLIDVGCGTGYFAREMAARGSRVTAVDISPRMIELARKRDSTLPLGIDYRTVDAARLDVEFAPGTFDIATSCLALQDMEEPARAMQAVAAVLRPGGRFVASIEHPCTNPPFRAWERDAHGHKRWLCIDRYYDSGPRSPTRSGCRISSCGFWN